MARSSKVYKKNSSYRCVIPGCGLPVPPRRAVDHGRLCDEHYAPVSEKKIALQIRRMLWLAEGKPLDEFSIAETDAPV